MLARLAFLFLLLLTPTLALAQAEGDPPGAEGSDAEGTSTEATEDDGAPTDEEARGLFLAGRAAFEQGQLERALEHFLRAYELSERPTLLFNIGNTHDRLRHDDEAIDYLTRYLEAIPEAENAPFVRSRIEVLRENVAARAREEEAQAAERARLEAAVGAVDATASDAGIALMIGGGAGLLVSIGPIVWLAQTTKDLNQCMPLRGCDVRATAGRQDAAIALTATFLVTSLLATGAGVVLFAIAPRPSAPAAPEVACRVLPGGIGCSGRF